MTPEEMRAAVKALGSPYQQRRAGAARGGRARARVLTPSERHEIAVRAARARWRDKQDLLNKMNRTKNSAPRGARKGV